MRSVGAILKDSWRLAWPYFRSEEKWVAWGLLLSVVGLNLLLNGLNLVLNFWNGAFFDAIQKMNESAFLHLLFTWQHTETGFMPGFVYIVVVYILIAVYSRYQRQWLTMRWRRWMTQRFMAEWLGDQTYYRMSLNHAAKGTDNPDQRISEDIRDFTQNSLVLTLDLFSNVITVFSFLGILWTLSGSITVFGITIRGYMVWVALAYSIVGTLLTHLVGRKLIGLNFLQQRFEANFRFSLMRVRENAEGVALYGGEGEENAAAKTRFADIVNNWWDIMRRTKLLNSLVFGYNQVAGIFPLVVAAPRYFAGSLSLGGLSRTGDAFGQVQGSMSWFVGAYASLADWSATVERLSLMHQAIIAARGRTDAHITLRDGTSDQLDLEGLSLKLPDGRTLLANQTMSLPAGESVVVTGRSGSGKSTLFRAIAGIWPFGTGTVTRPSGTRLFLPQRPYLPLGTLRHAVCYPASTTDFPDAAITDSLQQAGLGHLVERLDVEENWTQTLSGGEQQRLALARALLQKPDWLFLDEATANLDPESEADLYKILQHHLPDTTIVSIAHRPTVAQYHTHRLTLTNGTLTPAAPSEQTGAVAGE